MERTRRPSWKTVLIQKQLADMVNLKSLGGSIIENVA